MLDLDDPRWSQLQAAYGSASDIPERLHRFLRLPTELDGKLNDPDDLLYGELCHQACTAYTATYAAVPHIVVHAVQLPARNRISLLIFVAFVEAVQDFDAPPIPEFLREAYLEAIKAATAMTHADVALEWEKETLYLLLGALAVLRGFRRIGYAIMTTDEENAARLLLSG